MKANLLKTVFVVLIAVSGFTASAQDVSPVRHYFGVNYNFVREDLYDPKLATNFTASTISPPNPQWENGFGMTYEYIVNRDSATSVVNNSITSRLMYYSYHFQTNYNFGGGVSNSTQTEHFNYYGDFEASYSVVNISASWKKRFFKTPLYLSFGPNVTLIPSSKAYQDVKIGSDYVESGRKFSPEDGVEISEDGTRAKINYDNIGNKQWEIGLQLGVSVDFEVPNFLYNLNSKPSADNSIIIAPYAMINLGLKDIIRLQGGDYRSENQSWRQAPLQAGLDIRMPMPF